MREHSWAWRPGRVGRSTPLAATAITTTKTSRAHSTIRWRCWRVPEFRALANNSEVNISNFLCLQETGQGEHKQQKYPSKRHSRLPPFPMEVYLNERSNCPISW